MKANIPLHLCQVLEEEYECLQQESVPDSSWLFVKEHLKIFPPHFIDQRHRNFSDPLAQHLRERLLWFVARENGQLGMDALAQPTDIRGELGAFLKKAKVSDAEKTAFLKRLNSTTEARIAFLKESNLNASERTKSLRRLDVTEKDVAAFLEKLKVTREEVVAFLNTELTRPDLYDEARFKHVVFNDATRKSQFESYRMLGSYIMNQLCGGDRSHTSIADLVGSAFTQSKAHNRRPSSRPGLASGSRQCQRTRRPMNDQVTEQSIPA